MIGQWSDPMQWSRVSNSMFWGLPSPPSTVQMAKYRGKEGSLQQFRIHILLYQNLLEYKRVYQSISNCYQKYVFVPQKVEETFSHSGILGDSCLRLCFPNHFIYLLITLFSTVHIIYFLSHFIYLLIWFSPLFILRIFKSTLSILWSVQPGLPFRARLLVWGPSGLLWALRASFWPFGPPLG